MLCPYGIGQPLSAEDLSVSAINELGKVLWRAFLSVDIVDHTQESSPTKLRGGRNEGRHGGFVSIGVRRDGVRAEPGLGEVDVQKSFGFWWLRLPRRIDFRYPGVSSDSAGFSASTSSSNRLRDSSAVSGSTSSWSCPTTRCSGAASAERTGREGAAAARVLAGGESRQHVELAPRSVDGDEQGLCKNLPWRTSDDQSTGGRLHRDPESYRTRFICPGQSDASRGQERRPAKNERGRRY